MNVGINRRPVRAMVLPGVCSHGILITLNDEPGFSRSRGLRKAESSLLGAGRFFCYSPTSHSMASARVRKGGSSRCENVRKFS